MKNLIISYLYRLPWESNFSHVDQSEFKIDDIISCGVLMEEDLEVSELKSLEIMEHPDEVLVGQFADIDLTQWWATCGPRAACGPRDTFMRPSDL